MTTIPSISGFNVPLALRQLGNNMKLYTKLLDQFQKSYANASEELAASVDAGDFETAERSAHTIKGLAGSLGATSLQEVSAVLEKLCRDQQTGLELDAAIADFSREIGAAVQAIRAYLAQSAAPAPQAGASPVSQSLLNSQLAALAAHVDESDAKALMLFDEMRTHLAAYDADAAKRIAASFEIFDFPTAADIIASIRKRLG